MDMNQPPGEGANNDAEEWIALSDPDILMAEIGAVSSVLKSPRISAGPAVETFESEFAAYLGRDYAVAVPSGTLGALLAIRVLVCGEGGMVVTDAPTLASELRYLRNRSLADRFSVSVGSRVPLQAAISDLSAALGLAQLERIEPILARRKQVENYYREHIMSFEGIKPPYLAQDVDEVHWFVYLVHLGTRFTRSARNQIVDDLETELIEAAGYCQPLHLQYHYGELGYRKMQLPMTEKIADRAVALPFHGHLSSQQVKFIVKTMKDSSTNVGAGAAIY